MGKPDSRARLVVARCPAVGQTAEISRGEAAHARARRLVPGDPVTLVDGTGVEAQGRLLSLSRSGGEVRVEAISRAESGSPRIDLFIAGLRPERLSWIAEKATELAASRLVLVETSRTQSFRASAATVSRLARVAREAAKQCESARWPEVSGPLPLREALSSDCASRLFLDSCGGAFPQRLAGSVAILVGPEGGWTEAERAAARQATWPVVALPAGLLRAETAAVAALVLVRAALARASRAP